VSSLRTAAALLAGAKSFRELAPFLPALGFGESLPLDLDSRRAIGLDRAVRRAAIANGSGTLRALLLEAAADVPARETIARVASRVTAHAPQLLWLLVLVQPSTESLVIAAPAPAGRKQLSALSMKLALIAPSDAETLAAMADAGAGADVLVHHRWRELLGRDALTRRFYRELETVVDKLATSATGRVATTARHELALLCSSRILFLAFLEAKGWLDGDREFLRHAFDARCAGSGEVHRRLLDPLFFGTLNTPVIKRATAARKLGRIPFLNGGLFARTALERASNDLRFTDESLGELIGGLLARYRVTTHETSPSWSEAAIDPEMLGRAFESLMAAGDRRSSGAFYTPSAIIERVGGEGLETALASHGVPIELTRAARNGDRLAHADRETLRDALPKLRVLDPACGSGAFLVHLLERIADLARDAGDDRPVGARRRDVLTRSIFGVDVNPTAVWLCELRLWLSVVIDADESDPLAVRPLPNLDRHIRVGDALAGPAFDEALRISEKTPATLAQLRGRYARSTGVRKRLLARALDREERRAAIAVAERERDVIAARRSDLLCALRTRDLFAERTIAPVEQRAMLVQLRLRSRQLRRRIAALRSGAPLPFSFPVHFADAAANEGFDLIAGNPPWVRLHNIPPAARDALRARYRSFREAAWMPGAEETGAGRGFSAQVDLAALFVERSLALTRAAGTVALLLPAKLWRSLAGGGVRRVLDDRANLLAIEDWAGSRAAFDAAVYPSFLLARKRGGESEDEANELSVVRVAVHHRDEALEWKMARARIGLDDSPGAPWLLLPPDARAAFDRLAAAGTPLARTPLGRPILGVKSGCNEAFIVTPSVGWQSARNDFWPVKSGEREGRVERRMLRPLLRGESVRAWQATPDDSAVLWTHDAADAPMKQLPAGAHGWLAPWRRQLESRADAQRAPRWWSLFRTDAARSHLPRVVWSDIGKSPRALVLLPGDQTVPINSCYVARTRSLDDAYALAALLNSPIAAAWLAVIAEPARGGYHRYLGWTLARLPIPAQWARAVEILAPLAREALEGEVPDAATLTDAAIRAYRVRACDMEPLLTWSLR
jgi:Eco57I restriction-modification methylase